MHHYGYPGQTLQYIIDNKLALIVSEITAARDTGTHAKAVVTLHEGENGLIVYDAAAAYAKVVSVCSQLNALETSSFQVQIVLVPPVNRVSGAGLPADFNTRRNTLINSLRNNWPQIADAFVEPMNQLSVWGSQCPSGYPNTYCSDGTHPTTEGARVMGVELAQTMRALVGVGAIVPAYIKNIGYTVPPGEIDPETLAYEFAQMTGARTSQPADYSRITQSSADDGNFSTVATGLKKGRVASGQTFIADFKYTIGNAALQHVFGPSVIVPTNDSTIAFRAYPEAAGRIRIWDGGTLVADVYRPVASNDELLFRVYTTKIEVYHNGNSIVVYPRAANDTREFRASIVFGNSNPDDFFTVLQRFVNAVAA